MALEASKSCVHGKELEPDIQTFMTIAVTTGVHTVCMSLLINQYYLIAFQRIVQNQSVYSFSFFAESHTEICFRKVVP